MSRPSNTAEFWHNRLAKHPSDPRRLLWDGTDEAWDRMEAEHRTVLARTFKDHPNWSVLDCGCGYGRLLDLMPTDWHGAYLGVDVSPDLLKIARERHPGRGFVQCDLNYLYQVVKPERRFHIAVFVMVRHMMLRDLGEPYWVSVVAEVNKVAERVLCLEPQEVM